MQSCISIARPAELFLSRGFLAVLDDYTNPSFFPGAAPGYIMGHVLMSLCRSGICVEKVNIDEIRVGAQVKYPLRRCYFNSSGGVA